MPGHAIFRLLAASGGIERRARRYGDSSVKSEPTPQSRPLELADIERTGERLASIDHLFTDLEMKDRSNTLMSESGKICHSTTREMTRTEM